MTPSASSSNWRARVTALAWAEISVGLQRKQARYPARSACCGLAKNSTELRRGRRLGHDGRQYTPVVRTAKTNRPSCRASRAITCCHCVSDCMLPIYRHRVGAAIRPLRSKLPSRPNSELRCTSGSDGICPFQRQSLKAQSLTHFLDEVHCVTCTFSSAPSKMATAVICNHTARMMTEVSVPYIALI